MLRNPSLILCDEVTSSVDAFAEQDIIATLRAATAQRTTLTVAHRLSSVAHSDLIIVLEKGQIVETGTHQQLLQKPDGIYRRMWVAQNGLAIEEGKHEGEEGRRGRGGGEGEVERDNQEEVKDESEHEKSTRNKANEEISNWRQQREIRLNAKKEKNRSEEQVLLETLESEVEVLKVWERVTKLIDSSESVPGELKGSDTSRMRKLFIQLKNEPLEVTRGTALTAK